VLAFTCCCVMIIIDLKTNTYESSVGLCVALCMRACVCRVLVFVSGYEEIDRSMYGQHTCSSSVCCGRILMRFQRSCSGPAKHVRWSWSAVLGIPTSWCRTVGLYLDTYVRYTGRRSSPDNKHPASSVAVG